MLKGLNIENIAVIEKVIIDFSDGLNVLTGETGAGKSIIIDSINAVLGERTSRELVRSGANNGTVSAFFVNVSDVVTEKLKKYDLPYEEDFSLIVSRKVSSDGKNMCKINGASVTATIAKDISSTLINIHGQHDSQNLLNPDYHYQFIDMLIDNKDIFDAYSDSFKKLIETRRQLKKLSSADFERETKTENLKYLINEIETADLRPGEKDELTARREIITNNELYLRSLNMACDYLNGGDDSDGAYLLYSNACDSLSDISHFDSATAKLLKKMYDTLYAIEEYKDSIREKLDNNAYDPKEIETICERLDVINHLCKKYGGDEHAVLLALEEAKAELDSIENIDEEIENLKGEYSIKLNDCVKLADQLSNKRKEAAIKFELSIQRELAYLDMPKVVLKVNFEKGKLSHLGYDMITFLISTNPGEPLKGLNKIASGGELSRIMLAIKSIIAANDTVDTLIFDEIDTGVSGNASKKIGQKLKAVSDNCQVICVTHSAQIASFADEHLLISKRISDERTFTNVKSLDYNERADELSRIIGGSNVSKNMLLSAKEMLNENGGLI